MLQFSHIRFVLRYAETALLFTDAGFAVAGLDAQGFGRSDGLDGYIPNFDDLVSDAREFFGSLRSSQQYKDLPHFLFSESMGGAIALLLSLQEPGEWAGAVLCAPMVKVNVFTTSCFPSFLPWGFILRSVVLVVWPVEVVRLHYPSVCRKPGEWASAVLCAPMIKVSVINRLRVSSSFISTKDLHAF